MPAFALPMRFRACPYPSVGAVVAAQVPKPDHHAEGAFQLPVEMQLVTAEPLQVVRVEGLVEGLLVNFNIERDIPGKAWGRKICVHGVYPLASPQLSLLKLTFH